MIREHGFDFKFEHIDKDGDSLYDSGWLPNHMTDDGFELMYDVFFRDATAPTKFMIGLNTANLSQTNSLTDLSEVSGTGYSLQDVARSGAADGFPTLELDSNDMQITSTKVTFENTHESEGWTIATDAFLLADLETNVLMCYRPLTADRKLFPGDKLYVTIKVKGGQPEPNI